jgi:methyltransferase-like protein 6
MENDFQNNLVLHEPPELTAEMIKTLEKQNSRMVSEFQASKLESQACKNWNLFYKRNETRFFKDR